MFFWNGTRGESGEPKYLMRKSCDHAYRNGEESEYERDIWQAFYTVRWKLQQSL